ncbi:MAG TPA: S41 family peptidase [Pyrinomonadaceae bacterium]|nr:S41 family peptidase [Pyrinomonadaceae bacterium]
MKYLRRPLALSLALSFACALLWPAQGARTRASAQTGSRPHVSTGTREGRLALFEEVWQTIAARYYDPSLGGLDWQTTREKFLPLATSAGGEAEFYAVLRRMLATLRDPHTRVYAPGENGATTGAARFVAVGLSVREVSGEVLVVRVVRGSDAERAGVRAGDAVVSVEGEAVSHILARSLAERASDDGAQTRAARHVSASLIFDGASGTTLRAVFRDARGRERSVSLKRELRERADELSARRLDGRIGLISFNAFTPETAAQLARALARQLRDARGLVLDLRENGGGESEAMTDAASIFIDAGQPLGRFTNRNGRAEIEPRTRTNMLSSADALPRTRAPLVLLTSTRTASAAEVFVAALVEQGRAVVVGEQTCGCVLGLRRRHQLADGGALDISEMDFHTALGRRLEGVGIIPHERLAPTREDLRTGRDRALERALDILKKSQA